MEKIPTLFQRNHDGDHRLRDEVTPGCEWVIAGEGIATRKWDGTCCLVRGGVLYRRHELKPDRSPPRGFESAAPLDPATGKTPGWVPVGAGSEDKWHREAFDKEADGTYELCGPKVQGNPEGHVRHTLIPHGNRMVTAPCDFDGLREWLDTADVEGVVWYHEDGRMAKIKGRDFGLRRPTPNESHQHPNEDTSE